MVMISFRSKKDKEHLLEKAKRMEDYAAMIVECLENSEYEDERYDERSYRNYRDNEEEMPSRYNYRRMGR